MSSAAPLDYADLPAIEADGLRRLAAAGDLGTLREAEAAMLGRQSPLADLRRRLGSLPDDQRRVAGRAVNDTRNRLQAAAGARRAELETVERARRVAAERLDLTEVPAVPG
ncbi:MAG: phenylalanine--tRNA ligase subunit alpha, partial [Acidimicrobiales bacterium]